MNLRQISYEEFYTLTPGTKVYDDKGREHISLEENDSHHTYGMMVSVGRGTLHHHTEFGVLSVEQEVDKSCPYNCDCGH